VTIEGSQQLFLEHSDPTNEVDVECPLLLETPQRFIYILLLSMKILLCFHPKRRYFGTTFYYYIFCFEHSNLVNHELGTIRSECTVASSGIINDVKTRLEHNAPPYCGTKD